MLFFVAIVYLAIVGVGVVLLWVAYQVAIRKRLSLIRGNDRKPLPQAEIIAIPFAAMAALAGIAVLSLAVATALGGLRFGSWHVYLAFIAGIIGAWRQFLFISYYRRRAPSPRATEQ